MEPRSEPYRLEWTTRDVPLRSRRAQHPAPVPGPNGLAMFRMPQNVNGLADDCQAAISRPGKP